MNRTWSIVLWLVGEALLVAGFLTFGLNDSTIHLILNFVVSTVILTVVMMSLFKNTESLKKRGVGSGMKWFFTLTYAALSIAGMIYFGFFNPVDMLTQIIVQLIFFSVLLLGMYGTFKPVKKSEENTKYATMERRQLMMIRDVVNVARTKAESRLDVPVSIRQEIVELQSEVHQLTPGNEYVALKMEGKIMLEVNQLLRCLKEPQLDVNYLNLLLKSCFKLIAEFNKTYYQGS